MSQKKILGVFILLLISVAAHPQKIIRGFVIDSASFAPLGYVNIKIKNSFRGTSSDSKGGFGISTAKGDTLEFSLVGYNPEEFAAAELEETVIIRMAIKIKMLDAITIVGRKEKTISPIHIAPNTRIMNYGPYGPGVNLAYFSKLEKEKRKLQRVLAEHERIKNYIAVVCSPEIRERICEEYGLSDDQYYQLLAKFNIETMNQYRELSSEEWITVLRNFYASNTVRK